MTRLTHRLASTVAASALVLGGALAAAPAATAESHTPVKPIGATAESCHGHINIKNRDTTISGNNVKVHNGPARGKILGYVHKGTKVRAYCRDFTRTVAKVKVRSGANAGLWGWVATKYMPRV